MTPEQKKNVEDWIAALESGKYAKGIGCLRNPKTNTHCCLGVLAEIQGIPSSDEGMYFFGRKENHKLWAPDRWFTEKTGLESDQMNNLMLTNDEVETFDPIIKEIKSYVK